MNFILIVILIIILKFIILAFILHFRILNYKLSHWGAFRKRLNQYFSHIYYIDLDLNLILCYLIYIFNLL